MNKINLEGPEARTLLRAATMSEGVWPGAHIATRLSDHGLITPFTSGSPGAALYTATEAGYEWLAKNGHAEAVRRWHEGRAWSCGAQGDRWSVDWHRAMIEKINAWEAEGA
jgi:DNA-binding PadR family transcriptional regulator